jgi:hypothetical protein
MKNPIKLYIELSFKPELCFHLLTDVIRVTRMWHFESVKNLIARTLIIFLRIIE